MRPVLTTFHLFGREVSLHTYGILVALGFALGIALAFRAGRRAGLDGGRVLDLAFWILVVGLGGSRLTYAIVNADDFIASCAGEGASRSIGKILADCTRILQVWEGGLVFYGGAIAAAILVALFVRRAGWSFWVVGDVFAPSLALGHAFGRLGCFMAGCCFGKACAGDWGATFGHGSVAFEELRRLGHVAPGGDLTPPLHPTQLYESLGEVALFAFLTWLGRRKRFPGQVLLTYAVLYPLLRTVVEVFRGDVARRYLVELETPGLARFLGLPPAEPLFLSLSQGVSLVVVAVAAWGLWQKWRGPGTPAAPPAAATPARPQSDIIVAR